MRFLSVFLLVGAAAAACKTQPSSSSSPTDVDGGSGSMGPRDPGFANAPPAWLVGGGASIEDWVPPGIDPGVGRFDPSTQSGGVAGAFIGQIFPMPAFDPSERFALETNGTGDGLVELRLDNMTAGPLDTLSTRWRTRQCLGERAFGHDIHLEYRRPPTGDTTSVTVDLDHAAIVPAPECPAVGALANGDFSAPDAWYNLFGPEIAPSGGSENSPAAHVVGPNEGSLTHAPVSIPWKTMARPALRFAFKGQAGVLSVDTSSSKTGAGLLGFFGLGAVTTPAATLTRAFLCIPEWAKGLVLPFSFQLSADYVLDDVAIASEPSCPETARVIDGDFETASLAPSWRVNLPKSSLTPGRDTEGTGIVTGGGGHGGDAYLALRSDGVCKGGRASQTITVPPSEPRRGPAVKFWYKGGGTHSTFRAAGTPLSPAAAWTSQRICLRREDENRPTELVFELGGDIPPYDGGMEGCTSAAFPVETAMIDDVEATTDPACP